MTTEMKVCIAPPGAPVVLHPNAMWTRTATVRRRGRYVVATDRRLGADGRWHESRLIESLDQKARDPFATIGIRRFLAHLPMEAPSARASRPNVRPRQRRAVTRRLTRAGPEDSDPVPPAARPVSREERERLEAEHTRPAYLTEAFRELGLVVKDVAAEFEDAWPCRKCLHATLTTFAVYAVVDQFREMSRDRGAV